MGFGVVMFLIFGVLFLGCFCLDFVYCILVVVFLNVGILFTNFGFRFLVMCIGNFGGIFEGNGVLDMVIYKGLFY